MKRRFSRKFIISAAAAALLSALAIWTLWGNTALTTSSFEIADSRLPAAFSGFRIAQISDLHNAEFGEANARLLQMLAAGAPDIIVITGDMVDSRHTDIDVALVLAERAAKIAPVYYVAGNHEARLPRYDKLKSGLAAAGVVVLEDEAVRLERDGAMLTLIGLADPDFTISGDVFGEVPAMVGAKLNDLLDDAGGYTILLAHRPELFEVYAACGVDLVFSGHAHGGQFRLPLLGGLVAPDQGFFPVYDAGLYAAGGTSMLVSRGLGNSVIPLRFNNRPEVVWAELRAE